MLQYWAEFDVAVTFLHGGGLQAQGFRVAAFGTFPVRAYASVPEIEPHDHRRSGGWLPTAGG